LEKVIDLSGKDNFAAHARKNDYADGLGGHRQAARNTGQDASKVTCVIQMGPPTIPMS
jgi:hypothetical protein